jgi:transposase
MTGKKQRRARRTFTPEAKADAVRLVKAGKTVAQVAREHGLTVTALRVWVKQAEADAGQRRDVLTTEEREELSRLRRENRQLKQERDILKAAATFFAKASE